MKPFVFLFLVFLTLIARGSLKESYTQPYPENSGLDSRVVMASSQNSNLIALYYVQEKLFQFFQSSPVKYLGQFQDTMMVDGNVLFSDNFDDLIIMLVHPGDTLYKFFEFPDMVPIDFSALSDDYASKVIQPFTRADFTVIKPEKTFITQSFKVEKTSDGIVFYEEGVRNHNEKIGFKYLASVPSPTNFLKNYQVKVLRDKESNFAIVDYTLPEDKHQLDVIDVAKGVEQFSEITGDYYSIVFLPDMQNFVVVNKAKDEMKQYNLLSGENKVITSVPNDYTPGLYSMIKCNQTVDLVKYMIRRGNDSIEIYWSNNKNQILEDSSEQQYSSWLLNGMVNGNASELSPIISPDGKLLFVTRGNCKENTGGMGDQDIWFASLKDGQPVDTMQNLSQLNNKMAGGVISCSSDNNSLILFGYFPDQEKTSQSPLSRSTRTGDGWSYPKEIVIDNYINLEDSHSFSVSPDEQFIVMSIEGEDTYGHSDLYVSRKIAENHYSKPVNLGAVVNTFANDFAPFLSADNTTLYFSSYGHPGYGNADVFVTKRLDDTWTKWTIPRNLGHSINDKNWNAYFSISASGKYACMVKGTPKNREDVVVATLPVADQPDPVALITGKVYNLKNEPLEATIVYKELPSGKELSRITTSPVDGTYQIIIPYGKKYAYYAERKGYYPLSENIDLSDLSEYREIKRDLYLQPLEAGNKIKLNNIFFDYDKAELLVESQEELNRLAEFLTSNPSVKIRIEGHTDNRGSREYNLRLSEERAKAVYQYLIDKGIHAANLKWIGYGESKPVSTNETEEGMQKNRRVEFVIL